MVEWIRKHWWLAVAVSRVYLALLIIGGIVVLLYQLAMDSYFRLAFTGISGIALVAIGTLVAIVIAVDRW